MNEILFVLINSLLTGLAYGQIAIGLSLVYGVMRLVNFAHGELITFGMLFICYCELNFSLPLWESFALLIAIYTFVFFVFQKGILNNLLHKSETTQFLAMAAIAMIMLNINLTLFKADTYSLKASSHLSALQIGSFTIQNAKILSAIIACTSNALLFLFLNKTLIGKGIKAISSNKEKALLLGLPFKKLYFVCFIVLSLLLTTSALSLGLITNISTQTAPEITLLCFVIVILGGLGHIHGTLIAGIIIGTIETFISYYYSSLYKGLAGFLILTIILVCKPHGLFNKKVA